MFSTQRHIRGQSALEFAGIMVFVMMAIIIGGPYVVRSVNSHFKSIEEGTIDSEREAITEGPNNASLPTCDCTPVPLCGDGVTVIGGMPCPRTKRIFNTVNCIPVGCDVQLMARGVIPPLRCGDDLSNTCCGDWVDRGCSNDQSNTYLDINGKSQRRCPNDSQRVYSRVCGSPNPVTEYNCVADNTCYYQCAAPLDVSATWCESNAVLRNQGLPSPDYVVKYLNNSAGCPGANYCEARCDVGFTAGVGGCAIITLAGTGCSQCPNGSSERYIGFDQFLLMDIYVSSCNSVVGMTGCVFGVMVGFPNSWHCSNLGNYNSAEFGAYCADRLVARGNFMRTNTLIVSDVSGNVSVTERGDQMGWYGIESYYPWKFQ